MNNKNESNNNESNNNESNNTKIRIFSKNEWISASKTRNFALQDTLLDWLNHWCDKLDISTLLNGKKSTLTPNIITNTITNITTNIDNNNDNITTNIDNITTNIDNNNNDNITTINNDDNNNVININNNDNNNTFTKFIMDSGLRFEAKIINLIKKKVLDNEFVTICSSMKNYDLMVMEYEKQSIAEIYKGTPIIYQPVLMNHDGQLSNSYGLPDLLVRSDYLHKIIELDPLEKTRFYRAPNLSGSYHYVVLDIKFSTIELCSDGKRIRNSGSVPAYKCQLYIYNHALGKIQGYEPLCSYILGRKYKYQSRKKKYEYNNCFSRLGYIEYSQWDRAYITKSTNAVKWLKNVRAHGNKWSLLPKPTLPELYPNMASPYKSKWTSVISKYAHQLGEITLLWNCGVKNRQIAHQNGIYSYFDLECSANKLGINGSKIAPTLDKIININKKRKFDEPMDRIEINWSENANINNKWIIKSKLEISVDFETISNVVDDFNKLPTASNENHLFMIGIAYRFEDDVIKYKMFLAEELSYDAEFQMILQFYQFLRKITDDYIGTDSPIPVLHHWGHMERTFFAKICANLKKNIQADIDADMAIIQENLNWHDLLECFKENPIVINGCFKFGLKEVVSRLAELKLIDSKWNNLSECSNGNTAMIMAHQSYVKSLKDEISIAKIPAMHEIMQYNKIDCVVIHEIMDLVRRKYSMELNNSLAKKRIKK